VKTHPATPALAILLFAIVFLWVTPCAYHSITLTEKTTNERKKDVNKQQPEDCYCCVLLFLCCFPTSHCHASSPSQALTHTTRPQLVQARSEKTHTQTESKLPAHSHVVLNHLAKRRRLRCHQEAHFALCVAQDSCSTTKNNVQTRTDHNAQRKLSCGLAPCQLEKKGTQAHKMNESQLPLLTLTCKI
jgi:hypothetical protein